MISNADARDAIKTKMCVRQKPRQKEVFLLRFVACVVRAIVCVAIYVYLVRIRPARIYFILQPAISQLVRQTDRQTDRRSFVQRKGEKSRRAPFYLSQKHFEVGQHRPADSNLLSSCKLREGKEISPNICRTGEIKNEFRRRRQLPTI